MKRNVHLLVKFEEALFATMQLLYIYSRVAGLSSAKAKKIIEFRENTGPFVCREQLMCVKGLGEKSYEQAAGFVRVHTLNTPTDDDER